MEKSAGEKAARRASAASARKARPATEKRGRGRPPRISRDEVVKASIRILDTTSVEDFMIKTLARKLGTTSMAIYNYFDSRDALLEAVCDEICNLFVAPRPKSTWQDTLRAWLWALKEHADRYPVMPRVIGINGHTAAGWLKITIPVSLLIHDELGLRGKQLALATYVFVAGAITMINMVSNSGTYMHNEVHVDLDAMGLDAAQKQVVRKLPIAALQEKDIFNVVFEQLIAGLEAYETA